MRVFAFARRFPSVSQTFVLGQCTGLVALGADLSIFADGADSAAATHPDVQRAGMLDRTRYHNIVEPWWRRLGPALRILAATPALSTRQRLALIHPGLGAEARSLRLLFEAVNVSRASRAGLPAILHAHFGPVGAMVEAIRSAGVVDAPLVTTFYGYDVSRTPARVYRRLFARGDAFLALSETMRTRLVEMGAPPERTHVHGLGVDLAKFSPRAPDHSPSGEYHLLSIARLVPKKGIADALRAVAIARRRVPSIRYTIIGDGPLRGTLEALARSLRIETHVRFVGWRVEPEVLSIARTAHAVLAPSVTAPDGDAEGTPVAILEAQALGLPVISTLHAGIPDVVQPGVSARLVREHDVDALAEAIEALEDPALRSRMGASGRSFVERRHDLHTLNRELLTRFSNLIVSYGGRSMSTRDARSTSFHSRRP